MPLLLSPHKAHLPLPSPKYLRRLPAELMVSLGRENEGLGARCQLTDSSPMGVFVRAEHIHVSCAVGGQKPRMGLCSKGVDHGPELLVWQDQQW